MNDEQHSVNIGAENRSLLSSEPTPQINISNLEMEKLKKAISDLHSKVEEAERTLKKNQYDFIAVFSLLAGFTTYIGVEVQIFKMMNNPFTVVGISLFFLSFILLFVAAIHVIVNNAKNSYWGKNLILLLLSMVLSIGFVFYGWRDDMPSLNIAKAQIAELKRYCRVGNDIVLTGENFSRVLHPDIVGIKVEKLDLMQWALLKHDVESVKALMNFFYLLDYEGYAQKLNAGEGIKALFDDLNGVTHKRTNKKNRP